MSDVNANINLSIDSSKAVSQLRALQNQISAFNQSVVAGNVAAVQAQRDMTSNLTAQINATKAFTTSVSNVETSVSRLGRAIDKNKLSLGEYFRYGAAASGAFGKSMKEHAAIMELAGERVKRLQTQYIALEQAHNGYTRSMAVRPTNLFNADAAIGIQRQQIFNKLLHDGSTSLVNWGKNTQWAGRQLMVGFTVPLTIFGGVAGKIFMDLEKQVVQFKRVYGDLQTPTSERNVMVEEIKDLAKEFTKYGIAVSDTVALAAKAAATGATGADLLAATTEATRLATLGQIDYQQALDATISLQTALGITSKDLADATNFLNAVENQTVTSLDDITQAIPLVAPVIKGLGGDVKDLAVFMTAMREGGISANEGANALKSGLASLINPTKAAREQLAAVGINIDSILSKNKGDLRGLISEFGTALGTLGKFERQQTLAKMFGKYQFARMGALFANISKEGSQAARVMDLTAMSAKELGQIAEGELGQLEESVGVKFTAAIEKLKLAIAPIGEAFLKIATPLIDIATKIAETFNNLPDAAKTFIAWGAAIGGVLVPTIIMLVGLLGNFAGNIIKIGIFFGKLVGKVNPLSSSLEYLTMEQLDAVAASASLEGQTNDLTGAINVQRAAVGKLISAYVAYNKAAGQTAAVVPQGFRGRPARKMATGGTVPGTGNGDTVPAMLTPGETVVTKEATKKYAPILAAMNAGTLPGFVGGVVSVNTPTGPRNVFTSENFASGRAAAAVGRMAQEIFDGLRAGGMTIEDALERVSTILESSARELERNGKDISKSQLKQLDQIKAVTQQARMASGPERHAAHVFPQEMQTTLTGSQIISRAGITGQQAVAKLNAADLLNELVPGAVRMLQRSDLVADITPRANYGLRDGISGAELAGELGISGVDAWAKAAKMAGVDAAEAAPQFKLFNDRLIALAGSTDGLVADIGDAERGVTAFGDLAERAMRELRGEIPAVSHTFDVLADRIKTVQFGINSEMIPALTAAGISVTRTADGLYQLRDTQAGRGLFSGFPGEVMSVRTQGDRISGSGSYRNQTVTDAMRLSQFISEDEVTEFVSNAGRAATLAGQETNERFVAATGDMLGDSIHKYTNSPHPATDQGTVDGKEYGTQWAAAAAKAMQSVQTTGAVSPAASRKADIEAKKATASAAKKKAIETQINKLIRQRQMLYVAAGIPAQAALIRAEAEIVAEQNLLKIEEQQLEVEKQQAAIRASSPEVVVDANGLPIGGTGRRGGIPDIDDSDGSGISVNPALEKKRRKNREKRQKQISKKGTPSQPAEGRKRRISRGSAVGGLFALDGLVFAASMLEGQIGEMAQAIMPAVFGIQSLAMILPMLTNPIGLVIGALAATAAGLFFFKSKADEASANMQKLANAMIANSGVINQVGDFYGKKSLAKRTEDEFIREQTGAKNEDIEKAREFIESDIGKSMKDGLSSAISQFGKDKATRSFASNLGSMVLQGVLNPKQAKAIAMTMGEALGDKSIGISINGNLKELLGPDGQNILKSPLKLAVRLEQENNKTTQQAIGNLDELSQQVEDFQSYAGGLRWTDMFGLGGALLRWGQGWDNILGDVARGISQFTDPEIAKATENLQLAGMVIANDISQSYDNLSAAKERYKKISEDASKIDEKDIKAKKEAQALLKAEKRRLDTLEKTIKKTQAGYASFFAETDTTSRDLILQGTRSSIEEMFKDNPAMKMAWDIVNGKLGGMSQDAQFSINLGISSGTLNPSGVQQMMDLFANPTDAVATINFLVKTQGYGGANEIISKILNIKSDEIRKEAIIDLIVNTPGGLNQETLDVLDPERTISGELASTQKKTDVAKSKLDSTNSAIAAKNLKLQETATMSMTGASYAYIDALSRLNEIQELTAAGAYDDATAKQKNAEATEEVRTALENWTNESADAKAIYDELVALEEAAKKAQDEYNAALAETPALSGAVAAALWEQRVALQPLKADFYALRDIAESGKFGIDIEIDTSNASETEMKAINKDLETFNELPKAVIKDMGVDIVGSPEELAEITDGYDRFDSKKEKVIKSAVMQVMGGEGEPADKAVSKIENMMGSMAAFAKMPNNFKQNVLLNIEAEIKIRADIDATKAKLASTTNPNAGDYYLNELEDQEDALQRTLDRLAALKDRFDSMSGGDNPNPDLPGGGTGGGGGGEKKDPFKDFKQMILGQIKQYAFAEAKMKELLAGKYGLYKIMKMNKGIDDKIRAAGLSPVLAEYVSGLDPADAMKVIKKITNKRGFLNQQGRRLANAQIGVQVSQQMSEARDATRQSRMSSLAARKLSRSNVSASAVSAISEDPAKTAIYLDLVARAETAQKALDNARERGVKNLKNYKKEVDKANAAVSAYTNTISRQMRVEEGAAALAELRMEQLTGEETVKLMDELKNNENASQSVLAAVAEDDRYVKAIIGARATVKSADKDLADARKKLKEAETKEEKQKAREELRRLKQSVAEAKRIVADPVKFVVDMEFNADRLEYWRDQSGFMIDKFDEMQSGIQDVFEEMFLLEELASDNNFKDIYGMPKEEAEQLILKNKALIAQYQEQINGYETLNKQEQRAIDLHEREKKQWQDKIDAQEKLIENVQREIDLRNHTADILNHDLDIMSRQEDEINKTYQERIDALTKIGEINQFIANQQKAQIGLAQALTEGDVYAAAQAAEDMRAEQANFSQESSVNALETGRDNAIAGLTNQQGLTRLQIEDQLWQISQQNWNAEQQIYQLQQPIYAWKTEIEKIDALIREHSDRIWENNGRILDIQTNSIGPLEDIVSKYEAALATSSAQLEYKKAMLMYEGKTLEQWEMQNRQAVYAEKAHAAIQKRTENIFSMWQAITSQISEANKVALDRRAKAEKIGKPDLNDPELAPFVEDGKFDSEGYYKWVEDQRQSAIEAAGGIADSYYAQSRSTGGVISGDGARDSVPVIGTPGEFVIRKAMVDKYGLSMLSSINQGAFAGPRYKIPSQVRTSSKPSSVSSTNISAPVYNTYSVNVNATTSSSPDEIANVVINKIRTIESMSMRGYRGN